MLVAEMIALPVKAGFHGSTINNSNAVEVCTDNCLLYTDRVCITAMAKVMCLHCNHVSLIHVYIHSSKFTFTLRKSECIRNINIIPNFQPEQVHVINRVQAYSSTVCNQRLLYHCLSAAEKSRFTNR